MATVSEMPEMLFKPVEKVAQVAAKKLLNSAILSVLLSGVQESSANQSEQIIKLVYLNYFLHSFQMCLVERPC